jgi:hypothetical protein
MKKALVLVGFLAMSASAAQANTVFQLTVDNCSSGCNPGAPGTSMGTVTLTQNGANSVDVTVALVSPLKFVNTGLHETIDFNLSGSGTATASNFSNSNFSLSSTVGGNHFDGFGDFQYAIMLNTAQGAGGAQASPLSFTITRAGGLLESNFVANASGAVFGVDVLNPGPPASTGPIGTTGSTPVPDGGTTATLLGLSMLGLGFLKSLRA